MPDRWAAQAKSMYRYGGVGHGDLVLLVKGTLSLHLRTKCSHKADGKTCEHQWVITDLELDPMHKVFPLQLGMSDQLYSWPTEAVEDWFAEKYLLDPLTVTLEVERFRSWAFELVSIFEAHHQYSHDRGQRQVDPSDQAMRNAIHSRAYYFDLKDWERAKHRGGRIPSRPFLLLD